MTNPDTSPEAVERLIAGPLTEIARSKGMPVTEDDVDTCKLVAATFRALSAERDALRAQVERAETALKWYSQQVSIMSKATIDAGWAIDRLKADRGAVYAKYLKSRDQP